MINRNRSHEIRIGAQWDVIKAATKFQGIVLTVPKDECPMEKSKFELRCWRIDEPRWPNRGHVDGGDGAIFEVMMDEPLAEKGEAWKHQLFSLGVDVLDCNLGRWVRELCMCSDGTSQYYSITFRHA